MWQAAHMRLHCGGLLTCVWTVAGCSHACTLPCRSSLPPLITSCVPGATARSKGEWTEVEIPLSRFLLTWKGKVRPWAGGW